MKKPMDNKKDQIALSLLTLVLLVVFPLTATGQQWIQLGPAGTPPSGRNEHGAVYDPGSNRMIMFGGRDETCNLNDTWILTGANGLGGTPSWIQLATSGGVPRYRTGHTVVYDPNSNRLIVFGGVTRPECYQGEFIRLDDVWVLTNANGLEQSTPTWTQLSPISGPPSGHQFGIAVYDPASNRMIVFGGFTGAYGSSFTNEV